jgi:hypothetical protein
MCFVRGSRVHGSWNAVRYRPDDLCIAHSKPPMDTGPVTMLSSTPLEALENPPSPRSQRFGRGARLPAPALLVGVCVVLAHLPYLLGWFDPNPLLQQSALSLDVRPGLLPGADTLDPDSGYTSQALAHRAILDWLHGQTPWWNPFEGLGSPLTGEMQAAAFFPFIILLFFANGQALLYLVLCLIAAYSTYFLLRKLALAPWACFVGAVVFGLNGTFSWFRFAPSNPIGFLPLILLGVELAREGAQRHRRAHWWIIGVGVGLSVVAGFPETAYLDGLLALLWTLARLPGLLREQVRRYLLAAAAGLLTGILLAAPVLVAFADYLPFASLGQNTANLSHVYIPNPGVDTLFFPYVYGPLLEFMSGRGGHTLFGIWGGVGGYLTVALILLAVFGLIDREQRPLKIALAAWVLLFVGRSYGTTVFANFLDLIPGLSHVVTYRFMNASVSLAMAVLAAFGVRDILERRIARTRLLLATGLVTVVAVLAAKNAHDLSRTLPGAAAWEKASFIWAFGTILLVALVVASPRFRRLGVFLLVALLPVEAIAMFVVPELSAPRSGHVDVALVSFLKDHIGLDRFVTIGPFLPNYGSYYGISSLNENDLPMPKDFGRLVTTTLDPNAYPGLFTGVTSIDLNGLSPPAAFAKYARTYQELGVKYLLVFTGGIPTGPPGIRLARVYQDSLATVYQIPGATPYFQDTTPGCALRVVTQEQVRADCSGPSTLVRDELEMPGWSARVDGHPTPISSSRLFQQTVRLPAGRHTISYAFEPPQANLAWLGLVVGAVACAVSAGLVPWRGRRGTRPRHATRTSWWHRLAGSTPRLTRPGDLEALRYSPADAASSELAHGHRPHHHPDPHPP